MTLIISSELETKLVQHAAKSGQDPNALAEALLTSALDWPEDDFEDTERGIERGLAAYAAGRYRPFAEFAKEQREKHGIRR